MRAVIAITAACAMWVLVAVPRRVVRLRLPPRSSAAAALIGAFGTATVAWSVTSVPSIAGAVGLLGAGVPLGIEHQRAIRRRDRIARAWPDVLMVMRSRIAGGATLPDAFIFATETSADLAPAVRRAQEASFPSTLDNLRASLADPVADRILMAITMAHRAGGRGVGNVLSVLAASVADELRVQAAHEAALTEQRLTAGVALLAPWALLLLTVATNPGAGIAFRSGPGHAVIAGGLAATTLGFWLARRTSRLRAIPRIFR